MIKLIIIKNLTDYRKSARFLYRINPNIIR